LRSRNPSAQPRLADPGRGSDVSCVVRLRIVVWNCHGRLGEKAALLRRLAPDVAVVPECACPEVLLRRAIDLDVCALAWDGVRPDRGLGVLAFPPWRVAVDPLHRLQAGSTLPVRLSGPASLRLVAVWAMPPWLRRPRHAPTEPLADGLARLRGLLAEDPAVLAGDFNRTLVARRADGRLVPSALAQDLARLGLVSAYHQARKVDPGQEPEPTFFRLRRFPSPHHLDHVFLDAASARHVRQVELRGGARWMVWSDHVPLVVELALPSNAIRRGYTKSLGSPRDGV